MAALNEIGLLRANPLANASNMARLAECDCTADAACLDSGSATVADSVVVQSFVYQGVSYPFSPTIVVTNTAAIAAALNAVIGLYEVNPVIEVEYTGTALLAEHVGAGVLSSIVTSGNDMTLTRACEIETLCNFSFCTPEDGEVIVNGVDLAGNPFEYDPEDAPENATTRALLQTQVAAAIPGSTVVVTTDDDNERYCAVITVAQGTNIVVNDATLPGLNCEQVFTA